MGPYCRINLQYCGVMSVVLNPYIMFRDNAREVLEFYRSVFGGELTITTYSDMPGMDVPPGQENNVVYGQLSTENGLTIMASDTPEAQPYNGSISLSGDDDATLRGYFEKLSEGGQIGEPLTTAPWGDTFGMLHDKFGVHWMVNIAGATS